MNNLRGVRGATVANEDRPEEVLSATSELLQALLSANPSLRAEDLASAFFTTTPDLCSVYPAQAARQMGWNETPLMCAQEIPVPGSLPHCIRVLLHWNTPLSQADVHHVYLRQAAGLRPDLTKI